MCAKGNLGKYSAMIYLCGSGGVLHTLHLDP